MPKTDFIEKYRYRGTDERYRDYARTVLNGIDTEQLPPMIAGLIIQELTSLIDTAFTANVFTYVGTGITHEELWRFDDPEEYADEYQGGEIPDDASPVEMLDIYAPHFGIAQQSMWYGLDDYVDDFIVSLVGGLWYAKHPLQACITDFGTPTDFSATYKLWRCPPLAPKSKPKSLTESLANL